MKTKMPFPFSEGFAVLLLVGMHLMKHFSLLAATAAGHRYAFARASGCTERPAADCNLRCWQMKKTQFRLVRKEFKAQTAEEASRHISYYKQISPKERLRVAFISTALRSNILWIIRCE